MDRRGVVALAVLAAIGLAALGTPGTEPTPDRATVILFDGDRRVATIDAAVADTPGQRYTGLSEHDALAEDEGMLFVFGETDRREVVMRGMDFGIDVVFVDGEGCVTEVRAAPRGDPDRSYEGEAQYVLEVPLGVATDAGVEPGDPVRIEWGETTVHGREACGPDRDTGRSRPAFDSVR